MTYCVGMLLRDGIVMVADTRTNAGVDSVSSYRKLHVLDQPGRVVAIATAGSLSLTQITLGVLQEGIINPESGETETLATVPTMFRAAQLVGLAVRRVRADHAEALEAERVSTDVSFLVGGCIGSGEPKLYLVYSAGNFIECFPDTPFLQIGERKYGKPILDRALSYETDLYDAVKIALVSFDSTMRSNMAVGLPIDLIVVRRGVAGVEYSHRIEPDDPYFREISERWSAALKNALASLPDHPAARTLPLSRPPAATPIRG